MLNQIYVQGRQYITGKLVDQQSNGDRTRNVKEFWKQTAREEHSQGHVAMDICTETFPVCPVVCRSIPTATLGYSAQLLPLIDKQKHEAGI